MSLASLVLAKIKADVSDFRDVLTGADLAALREVGQPRNPTAFVLSLSESGNTNRYMTGKVAQRRQLSVAVIYSVKNARDAAGVAAGVDLDGLRVKVDAALFGWEPAAIYDPLLFVRGGLIELKDGVLWWQDEYSTQTDKRN